MAKMTFLEMVQSILHSMTGDEVNSWDDTVESKQVGHIIKQAYLYVQSKADLPVHKSGFELIASGDSAKPTLMTLPDDVVEIDEIRYDNKETGDTYSDYQEVVFVPASEFLTRQRQYINETSNVGEMTVTTDGKNHQIMYASNKMPEFYTTFDDTQYFFDSYDSTEDTTLQASKTLGFGTIIPGFSFGNSTTFDLNQDLEIMLLNEAKSLCFSELKQLEHPKAERTARQIWTKMQNSKRRTLRNGRGTYETYPNYGRRRP